MSWIRHNAGILLCLLWYAFFLAIGGSRFEHALHVDFLSYYYAAKLAWQGAGSPFIYERLAALAAESHHRVAPFLYLPPSLFLFYPLTGLELDAAKSWMVWSNHVAFALLLFLILPQLARHAGSRGWWRPGILPAYVLLFFPVQATFDEGQVNLWVLVLLGGGWLFARSRALPFAGLPLALATFLKPHLLLLFVALLLTRQYRVLRSFAAWVLGMVIVSVICLPVTLWSDWWEVARMTGGFVAPPVGLLTMTGASNHSTYGVLARWLLAGTDLPALTPASMTVFYGVLGVSLFTIGGLSLRWFWRVRAAGSSEWGLHELNLFLVTLFLASPLSWEHHLVLLLPALLCLLEEVVRAPLAKGAMVKITILICLALRLHEAAAIGGPVSAGAAFGLVMLRSLKWVAVLLLWRQCLAGDLNPVHGEREGEDAIRSV